MPGSALRRTSINSDDEVREAVESIGGILDDESWKQHTEARDFVT
jgi:hypothetical protein